MFLNYKEAKTRGLAHTKKNWSTTNKLPTKQNYPLQLLFKIKTSYEE